MKCMSGTEVAAAIEAQGPIEVKHTDLLVNSPNGFLRIVGVGQNDGHVVLFSTTYAPGESVSDAAKRGFRS